MEKRQSLQQMVLGKLDNDMKNEPGPLCYSIHKNKFKMMKYLNMRHETIIGKGNKSKNELLGPHQDKKLLHSKGNNQQS